MYSLIGASDLIRLVFLTQLDYAQAGGAIGVDQMVYDVMRQIVVDREVVFVLPV